MRSEADQLCDQMGDCELRPYTLDGIYAAFYREGLDEKQKKVLES